MSWQWQVFAARLLWGSRDSQQHAEAAGIHIDQLACSLLVEACCGLDLPQGQAQAQTVSRTLMPASPSSSQAADLMMT